MEPTDLEFTINGKPVSPCDISEVLVGTTVRIEASEAPIYAELTRLPEGSPDGYECNVRSTVHSAVIASRWHETWQAAMVVVCADMRCAAMAYKALKAEEQAEQEQEQEQEPTDTSIVAIVRAYLERTGQTLRNEYIGCECGLDNLMKCGGQTAGWICDCCAVTPPPEPNPDDIGIFTRRCEQHGCFASERVYVTCAAEASVDFYQRGWRKAGGKWSCPACAARWAETTS